MQGETIDINFKADIFQQLKELKEQFGQLNGKVSNIEQTSKKSFASVSQSLKAISFVSITQGLQNLNQGFQDLNAPGLKFSSALADVEAITGVTGKQLDLLGQKARESAKEFGGTASDSLETYKTILSRLGPGIGQNQKALEGMERNVRVLSKTMGGDAVGATDALTTAMLQYGVDLSNPLQAQKEMSRMMNVMAAGAKEGAAEVPGISEALKVAGVQAKQSKVSFEETNSALQSLAAGGKQGSEAGVALRNVLGKMAGDDIIPKEASMKLKKLGVDMRIVSDTSLPFTSRLRELKKAQGDATIMSQMFGVENSAAAQILLNSVDAQDELTKKITNTTVAQDQANVVMETTAEKVKRMEASIADAKISFFEATGGATAFLEPISQLATTFSSFIPLISGSVNAIKWLGKTELATTIATKATTAAQWLWNVAMNANPIGLLITGVAAAAVGIYALSKAFNSSTASEQLNATVKQRVIDQTIDERVELTLLFDKLKRAKKGTDEYKDTLKQLDDKYPNILKKYDLQKGKIEDINKAEKDLILSITKRAQEEAKAEVFKEQIKKDILERQRIEKMRSEGKGVSSMSEWLVWGEDSIKDSEAALKKSQSATQKLGKELFSSKNKDRSVNPKTQSTKTQSSNASPLVSPTGYSTNSDKTYSGAGGEMKNINVRIENLVKEINISTSNLKEGAAQVKQQITEAMVAAVRDFEVSM